MTASEENVPASHQDRLLGLISAVAAGDAAREDVAAELRDAKVDALDVLIDVLAQATQKTHVRRASARRVDPQQLAGTLPARGATETVHRPPTQPFLLRGTVYDPQDIARFNGTDLHVVSAPGREELLAFDDRTVMENWWQLSYVSATLASSDAPLKTVKAEPTGIHPTTITGTPQPGRPGIPDPGPSSGPEGFVVPTSAPAPIIPHTNFWEDINFEGSRIELKPGWEYDDLTEVSYTFFGTGDWNDTISSVQLVSTGTAVLWEHINRGGSSFTTTSNVAHLGWFNDLASSCATW
jgi:hypothetical protein